MELKEAKVILEENGYQLKEKTTEVPTNKVYCCNGWWGK